LTTSKQLHSKDNTTETVSREESCSQTRLDLI